jgi:hypothetical protein
VATGSVQMEEDTHEAKIASIHAQRKQIANTETGGEHDRNDR